MSRDIHIKFTPDGSYGEAVVHLDEFFPTTASRLRKLMKLIEVDWEGKWDILRELREYLSERVKEHKAPYESTEEYKRNETAIKQYTPEIGWLTDQIDELTKELGTRMDFNEEWREKTEETRAKIDEYKKKRNTYTGYVKCAERDIAKGRKKWKRDLQNYEKNLETVKGVFDDE